MPTVRIKGSNKSRGYSKGNVPEFLYPIHTLELLRTGKITSLDRIYQFAPEDRKRVVDATAIYLDGALAAKRILAAQNPA